MLQQKKSKKKNKYKEWRLDTLRNEDFNQMRLMTKQLQKLRNEEKSSVKKSNFHKGSHSSNNVNALDKGG